MNTTTRRPGPGAATLFALAGLPLAVPALALFGLTVAFLPASVVVVGLVGLLAVVPATRGLADLQRRLASWVLAEPVPSFYKDTRGLSPLTRLRRWAGDPARWRDLLWLLTSFTVGVVLSALTLGLLLGAVFYLIYPFLYRVAPSEVFSRPFGLWTLGDVTESFGMWVFAVLTFALWWFGAGPLMRLRARIDRSLLSRTRAEQLQRRVRDLTTSRAETVDHSATELRRIERDLHDGAQARLVALGMSLGMADDLMTRDPEAARRLLAEARSTTTAALGDLRSVVRGIHPPVLSDRGLVGAVEALAIDMAVPVIITAQLAGRPPAPVESAAYFAVAECLTNTGKHAAASRAWVRLRHENGRLLIEAGDDGRGGADPDAGTGVRGVLRRLSAFDGTLTVSSPVGGPTIVTMEVPCELSSPKTTHSSGTA